MIKNDPGSYKVDRKAVHGFQDAEKIEALIGTLYGYSRKLANGPNEKSAKGILRASDELSKIYREKLICEFESSFRSNIEHELWKSCFYSPIESLRKRSSDGGPHAELFKGILSELIEQAINFYENLLVSYEEKFCVDFRGLYQSYTSLLLSDCLDECICIEHNLPVLDSMVLRSVQRLFICSADLYRYKALNTNKETRSYSSAKKLYWQAHFLEPINGHPFNQLAVIACYEKKWVDVLFYYIRALSVLLPFKTSRESLVLALNSLREPALAYEKWFFEIIDKENINLTNSNGFDSSPFSDIALNYREIWIHPSSKLNSTCESFKQKSIIKFSDILNRLFMAENGKNVQKKTICHLIHCAGILFSTIGLDHFKHSYQLILNELMALILIDDTILSSSCLLKIIILYTFPVHLPKTDASTVLIENQRSSALEIVFLFFESLLKLVSDDLDKIGLFILAGQLSKKFSCILPSICFLLFWLSRLDKCLLSNDISKRRVFELIVLIANKMYLLFKRRMLCKLCMFGELDDQNKDFVRIVLPEFLLLTPYFDILSKSFGLFFIDKDSIDVDISEKGNTWLAIQARFAFVLCISERLASDEYFPITIDNNNLEDGPFRMNSFNKDEETVEKHQIGGNVICDIDIQNFNSNVDLISGTSTDEHELKNQLLTEEVSQHKIVEVRPKYLVCDTNTLIDYPDEIKFLVDLKIFILLVPTIVIDELSSLVKGIPINSPTLLPRQLLNPEGSHSDFIMRRATQAINWLRESAEGKTGNVFTITVNGNIIQKPCFVTECGEYNSMRKTNDDKILSACINLCRRLVKTTDVLKTYEDEAMLQRTVVLLTEDRGLSAKALAEWIPVRTFPTFLKWAIKDTDKYTKII